MAIRSYPRTYLLSDGTLLEDQIHVEPIPDSRHRDPYLWVSSIRCSGLYRQAGPAVDGAKILLQSQHPVTQQSAVGRL